LVLFSLNIGTKHADATSFRQLWQQDSGTILKHNLFSRHPS
jgi:hypothetical protein